MVNPSLTYEILLYLNSFYFGMFAACEFGMGLLKAVNLAYAENKLALDAGLMILLFVIETLRIYLGRKGNLSEHDKTVCISIFLTIPSAIGVSYFLIFQSFILRLEYILCSLMLALQGAELFFAIMYVFTMCQPPSYD
ncbi:transmembrane protein 216-like [Ctenocephalides felis]|uniref:transmembrane protein 216-like n=1 Tax=Ctenocephalides felis TaxID=7515 RepID=UPI000E6E1A6C|nr:transmembrane protein 216-like [Ctenocephalides felis]